MMDSLAWAALHVVSGRTTVFTEGAPGVRIGWIIAGLVFVLLFGAQGWFVADC